LAVLGNFNEAESGGAVADIVQSVDAAANGEHNGVRLFNRLRILAQIRNLTPQVSSIMELTSQFLKEQKNLLFITGEASGEVNGEQKKAGELVINLIEKLGLNDAQAAETARASLDFVSTTRAELSWAPSQFSFRFLHRQATHQPQAC
jgi:hypothetical protein